MTSNFVASINNPKSQEIYVTLLTLAHEDLATDVCIASDNKTVLSSGKRGTISNDVEYIYVPFKLTLPNLEQDVLPVTKLTVDNVSRELYSILVRLTSPPAVRIQIVLASDPDVVEYDLQGLKMNKAPFDEVTISGEFSAEYFFNEPYPSVRFTPSRFPGLFKSRNGNTNA